MIRSLAVTQRYFARTYFIKLAKKPVAAEKVEVKTAQPEQAAAPEPVAKAKPPVPENLGVFQQFTARGMIKPKEEVKPDRGMNLEFHVHIGRSWTLDELRLKSNDDLHKLWYVLLKEKNRLLGDAKVAQSLTGSKLNTRHLEKVQKSMNRLSEVVREREVLCKQYRRRLEDNYAESLKEKLKENYEEFDEEQRINPPISYTLLRAKYEALKLKVDDLSYIDKEVEAERKKKELKDYLRDKYAYGKKKVVDPEQLSEEQRKNLDADKHIVAFKNHIERQLAENVSSYSQEEILRAHVKNWAVLNLKQRRVVLHYINQRRAQDAKNAFVKELNLLAQKIAYENKKEKPVRADPL